MKKIAIIFAMNEELFEAKNNFKTIKEHTKYNLTIYECTHNKNKIFLVESGIGKVNAARTTQVLISDFNVDMIFNVGVAGAVSKDIKINDIVIADKLVQHDFDLTSFNHEKGYIPGIGKYIECNNDLLKEAKSINKDAKIGTIASGDIFVSDEIMARKVNFKFNSLCVDMESAAIAQVCHICNIPFLVIRSISDTPYEKNNNITFDEYLKESSKVISDFLIDLLEKI